MRHIYPLFFLLLFAFGAFCGCNPAESASSEPPPEDPPAPSGCTSIALNPAELTLGAGRTAALTLTWRPEQSTAPTVDWRSSDDTIASISHTGEVTAHTPGSAVLTAQTPEGLSAHCTITVVPLEERSCSVTVSLFQPASLEEKFPLPDGTTWEEIVWHSSDDRIAAADGAEITVLHFGSAQLTGVGPTVQISCAVQTTYGGQIIAHRGLSSEAPENTLPAFRLAGESGAWGIETDLHCTSDGVFVCLHDEEIDKMTNGEGIVSNMSYDTLQQYHIDAGANIANYASLTVPTLEEYLSICREFNAVAVIELKEDFPSSQIGALCRILEETGMAERCVCISFQFSLLTALREETAEIPVQYVVREAEKADVDLAASLGNSGIDFRDASPDLVTYARSLGCTSNVWTVDDPETQQYWRDAGIDFITSNTFEPERPTSSDESEEQS